MRDTKCHPQRSEGSSREWTQILRCAQNDNSLRTVICCYLTTWVICSASLCAQPIKTFCNPLNLDYGLGAGRGKADYRHGADPVIVLFKDRYWLFSTWDKPGYRVSDDLIAWKYIPFAAEVELPEKTYTAAAVVAVGEWMYFTEIGNEKKHVALYRTREPETGKWEKVAPMPPYSDPCLFLDPPSGRLFMYHGLDKPIRGVELDRQTFAQVADGEKQLIPTIDFTKRIRDGWEICTWDNSEASPGLRSDKSFKPCREGSWMTFFNGKYYLQYASPGTTVPGYADGLMVGETPLGPFEYSQHSPISRKASGFITSAGHSCLFQDKYGNWWRAATMLIGVHHRFERRIGLFPAGFDSDGIPYTRTELGDLPITMPAAKRDHLGDVHAGWWRLPVAEATASSSLDDHGPALAADENVRTWWAARETGQEWLRIDLGQQRKINAVQINLAEQDVDPEAVAKPDFKDVTRFALAGSDDGTNWTTLIDRSGSDTATPHYYEAFDPPVRTRYLKLRNVRTPAGGKFAVSDLRAFGIAEGDPPGAVKTLAAERDAGDRRKVKLTWTPANGATGYLIRYGIEAGKLYQHELISVGETKEITLYCLNDQPPYHLRIDAVNASGLTKGDASAIAP